jgi:hypothetical protein
VPVDIRDRGRYELFETTHGHRILVLNGERWFAWIEGDEGEILVHSDSDHERDHTIRRGEFLVVDFENDPKYKDMPHLFLQDGESFRELMIPNGLPTEQDHQKKVVRTDETLPREKLRDYLEDPAPAGEGESRMDRPGGGSMANVAHYLRGIDFPANREEIIEHAHDRAAPDEVLDQLEKIGARGELSDMAEVMEAVGEAELREVRAYERDHKDRTTMLEEIDRRLDR